MILLVAIAERKIRIEVGYGAEGRFTDALSARIIREITSGRMHRGEYGRVLRRQRRHSSGPFPGLPVTGVDLVAGAGPLPDRGGGRRGTGWGLAKRDDPSAAPPVCHRQPGRGGSFPRRHAARIDAQQSPDGMAEAASVAGRRRFLRRRR